MNSAAMLQTRNGRKFPCLQAFWLHVVLRPPLCRENPGISASQLAALAGSSCGRGVSLLHPEKGRAPREGWWRSSLQPAGHPTNPFSSDASSPPQGLEAVSLPEALFYLEKILEFEFVALVCLR